MTVTQLRYIGPLYTEASKTSPTGPMYTEAGRCTEAGGWQMHCSDALYDEAVTQLSKTCPLYTKAVRGIVT